MEKNLDVILFNDSERIQRNYCDKYVKHMLCYRFSYEDLRKIAAKQGLKKSRKYDRAIDELDFFSDKIYEQMDEKLKKITVKCEKRLFFEYDSIEITEEERAYHNNKFEELLYKVVQ